MKKKPVVYQMKLTSTPVVAKAKKLQWKGPEGPDPIEPKQYEDTCGVAYNSKGVRCAGYLMVDVLPFLWGKPMDQVAMAYINTLRPSYVRIVTNSATLDSRLWRVTVQLKAPKRRSQKPSIIEHICQEVQVLLPKGVSHGHALELALKYGIDSPRVKWHEDAESYGTTPEGHYKVTRKGETVWWKW